MCWPLLCGFWLSRKNKYMYIAIVVTVLGTLFDSGFQPFATGKSCKCHLLCTSQRVIGQQVVIKWAWHMAIIFFPCWNCIIKKNNGRIYNLTPEMHIPIIPYTRNNKGLMKQLISNWNWFEVTIQFHLATGVHIQWGLFKTTSHPRVQFEWNNDENSWHPGEDITLMWIIIIIITTSHQERIACCNNRIFPVRCNMDPHMYHSLARGRRGFWSEVGQT